MNSQDGYCPNCGASVPEDAQACPECGSCEDTGWSEQAKYERIGVEYEDTFDYDTYVGETFEDRPARGQSPMQWVWMIVALLLVALFLKWSLGF